MIFNTTLAESATEYDVIQESNRIKTIEDANEELKLIKAGKHKQPLKWISYVLKAVIPAVLATGVGAAVGTIIPYAGFYAGLAGFTVGLNLALDAALKGAPGSIKDKYKDLVALRPKVDTAIRNIENNDKIDNKEKQNAITQLRRFRDNLDKEITKYKNRIGETGEGPAAFKRK